MFIDIRARAVISVTAPTPTLLQIEALDSPGFQRHVSESLTLSLPVESDTYADIFGNRCRRFLVPRGQMEIDYRTLMELGDAAPVVGADYEDDILTLPPTTLPFLLASRYCQAETFLPMATDLFGDAPAGVGRVRAICAWINQHVSYEYGESDTTTTAQDTVIKRAGVCRDFAHLAITFCRALNIPARYCAGYCVGLEFPDFHAYFEAYVGGRWVVFDATSPTPRPAFVRIAVGRDAVDCAWSTFFGYGETLEMSVEANIVDASNPMPS